MSNIINPNYSYTYDGNLNTEVFIKPAVLHPDILQIFRVIPGIKYKQQLNIGFPLGKTVKGAQGCGDLSVTGDAVEIQNRELEVCRLEMYLEQCSDTFEATILGELLRSGVDAANLTGTQLGAIINGLIIDSLRREVFRIFSFGDTTSPAGPADYYNVCDGLWTRMFDGVASYDVTEVNGSISSLSATDAKNYLQALYTGAPIILKQIPAARKKFFVTGNVYEALMAYYENNANAGGFVVREENGVTMLRYRGIEVVGIYAWDDWIDTDNLGNNTRLLYTAPDNHVIGIEESRNQGRVQAWYDQNTKFNKFRGEFRLGYNYLHGGLQAISYGNV